MKEGLLPHGYTNIDLAPVTTLLNTKVQQDLSQEELFSMSQKAISVKIDLQLQSFLADSLTDMRGKARFASLNLAHAGDWLNVVPSPVLGLHVRPQEFRYAILYRLGAPLYTSSGPCPACGIKSCYILHQ